MKTMDKRIMQGMMLSMWALVAVALLGCAEDMVQSMSSRTKVEIVPKVVPMDVVRTRAQNGLDVNSTGFSCLYAASATTTTSPDSKAKIMIDDGASSYTAYTYQVTGSSTLSVVGDAPTFPAMVNSVNVYGWYPYTAANSFSIQSNQSTTTGYCLSDLMLANKATCTRDASSVTPAELSFRHVMSKIKIVLTPGSGVTVTDVALNNVKPTVAIDDTDKDALAVGAASGAAGNVTLLSSGSITSASAAADKTLCGVIPAQTISSSFITVTASLGGTPSTITYSFTSGSKTFTAAKEYTVNISVSAEQTGSPTIDISDWTGAEGTVNIGSGGGGGDAPSLSPTSLTLTYGGASGTITPTFAGATTFSGISSNTSVATVTGTSTLTVAPVAAGTCTINVFPTNATTGFSSAACNVTVNKAAQTVSLSTTSLSIGGIGSTATFTVTRQGDGVISAASSNTSKATTSVNQGTGVVTVTNVAAGSATITVTVAEGTNHLAYSAGDKTVAVTTTELDIRNNPLWRVAQYNVQSSGNFATSHSTSSPPVWNFNDAKTIGNSISGYHQPTMKEQASVFPMDKTTGSGTNIWGLSETLASPKAFSEITCTVNGSDVSASTSYIGKNAGNDYYAVRFIGTNHATAWHYKWVTSPCAGLLIESYMLSSSMTASEAQALLATLASSTIFTGAANAGTANQTPASTTVTTSGFVQRFLPACGCKYGSSGIADQLVGTDGRYWSSTAHSSSGFHWRFDSNGGLYENSNSQSNGGSVRLFRDN